MRKSTYHDKLEKNICRHDGHWAWRTGQAPGSPKLEEKGGGWGSAQSNMTPIHFRLKI